MRSYFVPLADKHIVMAVKQMGCRYDCIQNLDGVHCPRGKVADLADLLGLKVGSSFLIGPQWNRVPAIRLPESVESVQYADVEWNGVSLNLESKQLVIEFSQLLEQKVFVHGGVWPSYIAPKDEDGFHLYLGASAMRGTPTRERRACCGNVDVFDFSGDGIELQREGRSDFCRAELIDARHLYILADYSSVRCGSGRGKFLDFLREDCLDLSLVVSEAQWPRMLQRYRDEQDKRAMKIFTNSFSLDEFKETIQQANIVRDDIFDTDIPRSVSAVIDSGLNTMAEVSSMECHVKEAQKLAKTEIAYCQWVGDEAIEFLTRDLESTAGPIGAFIITLSLNGNVQVRGVEWVYGEACGPNLLGDGRLFPSELNLLIPQLIAEKRFVTLVSHIIHFLKDVDEFPGQRALVEKFNQQRSAS